MKKIFLSILLVYCISFDVLAAVGTAPTNMVVDFDDTAVTSTLHAGEGGILNLVVANTGGYRAENVGLYITGPQTLEVEKRFTIGTVNAGASKTLTVPLKVAANAKAGFKTIQVVIDYDGYDSDGDRQNDRQTKWEIPITIQGSPNFEVSLDKTTFYKDTLDRLTITGFTRDAVQDVTATLSSSCVTFIGSSRKYVGNLEADKQYSITYEVKPTASGACQATLTIAYTDASGAAVADTMTLGLNIEDAGVDFKVMNVSYGSAGPGETVRVNVALKNVGKAKAEDATVSLSLSSPFVPVDTTERYVGPVGGGEIVEASFDVAVGWDAEIKPYSIPLKVTYKVGGTSYNITKDIGIDVTGKVILEIINIDTSRGLQIDVANIGTRTAEGVKAILTPADGGNFTQRNMTQSQQAGSPTGARPQQAANPMRMLAGGGSGRAGGQASSTSGTGASATAGVSGQLIEYKSNIKPTAQTTFTFDSAPQGDAILTLEYTGPNNERVTQTERLTVGSASRTSIGTGATGFSSANSGTSTSQYVLYGLAALLILWVVYRKRKRQKIVPDAFRNKIKRK